MRCINVYKLLLLSLFCMIFCCPAVSFAGGDVVLSKGQTIYVPAYSHIYSGDREHAFLLTVTLSIRNTDLKQSIRIMAVDYYETQGKHLKSFLEKPVILAPLESVRYVIPESDKTGGSGANFIVVWDSDNLANQPIAESIMIGTRNQQGVSFTSRGQAIEVKSSE